MKKFTIFILPILFITFFQSCSLFSKGSKSELSILDVKELVTEASNGNKEANDSLKNLFVLGKEASYAKIVVDSILNNGKKYYLILALHHNPKFNKFAVYSESLYPVLIDKSLNGDVELGKVNINDDILVSANEIFYSKDIIELHRTSYYKFIKDSVNLVFREYTLIKEPEVSFAQQLVSINGNEIKTAITSSDSSINSIDTFFFDQKEKCYLSENNSFSKLLIGAINEFQHTDFNPQLTIDNSELNANNSKDLNEKFKTNHFLINLKGDWQEFSNYKAIKDLKKELHGFDYRSDSLRSSIFIAELPVDAKIDNYVKYKLKNQKKGTYQVFYSDKIVLKEYILEYFEFKCDKRHFILIFNIAHDKYVPYKSYFEDIINTFNMDC